jgi:hypothetical protein
MSSSLRGMALLHVQLLHRQPEPFLRLTFLADAAEYGVHQLLLASDRPLGIAIHQQQWLLVVIEQIGQEIPFRPS